MQDITALTVSLFGYRDTHGWDQLGNPRTVTMIALPFLLFLYFFIFLLLECFATNFEVDLIILAFLLWLNGIFLDTNYVIKKVFWEIEVLFKKVSKTYRWENCFQVLHVTPRAPCEWWGRCVWVRGIDWQNPACTPLSLGNSIWIWGLQLMKQFFCVHMVAYLFEVIWYLRRN